jgi:hypothetical protein
MRLDRHGLAQWDGFLSSTELDNRRDLQHNASTWH